MWLSVAWAPLFLDFKFWHHTFSCGNKTKCPFICWWHSYIHFLLSVLKYTYVMFVLIGTSCQTAPRWFWEHPTLPLSKGLSVALKTSPYYVDSFLENMHMISSFFFLLIYSIICPTTLLGNCSQATSGWYLTLSYVSLLCSATFQIISLPTLFGSAFLTYLALTLSSWCHVY